MMSEHQRYNPDEIVRYKAAMVRLAKARADGDKALELWILEGA